MLARKQLNSMLKNVVSLVGFHEIEYIEWVDKNCIEEGRFQSRGTKEESLQFCDTFYSYVGNAFVFRRSKVEHEMEEKQKILEVAGFSQRKASF